MSQSSLVAPYPGVAWFLLVAAAIVPALQVAVPQEHFIHRGDDAFYYFLVALNYADHGIWTFDGINSTNGVQPLWAMILSVCALFLEAMGIDDRTLAARVFVGVAVMLNVAAAFLLFDLLRRAISTGTGLAAAGAFLLPLGIVWQRSWGMENSLYALLLTGVVYWYHFHFRLSPSVIGAVVLGALLGLLALARLNAGLFIPILLVHFLFFTQGLRPAKRFWLSVAVGLAASCIVLPYLSSNWQSTGHLMPISGVAKGVYAEYIAEWRQDASPLSLSFWTARDWQNLRHLSWFATSRIGDGFWILGSRYLFEGGSEIPEKKLLLAIAFLSLLPITSRPNPKEWFAFLFRRLGALGAFWYVLAFGFTDFVLSILLYPQQLGYAITRWWWVQNEIIIVVLAATFAAAVLSFLGRNIVVGFSHRRAIIFGPLIFLMAHLAERQVSHYWSGERQIYDWNLSGNEVWFDAAKWLSENIPENKVVGGWNVGVLAYYSPHSVVNLDGLINNFDYLEYMRDRRTEDYIRDTGIEYLADMESMFQIYGIPEGLQIELVYDKHSAFYNMNFKIFRVVAQF